MKKLSTNTPPGTVNPMLHKTWPRCGFVLYLDYILNFEFGQAAFAASL